VSLRLVLTHYMESLREREELDALLPELLLAMGHSVISRPQIGVGQAGVDLVSLFPAEGENAEVYLWILKFGDVGRADLFAGQQAIGPSLHEACTAFVEHRLDARLRALPIHPMVVSNGELRQDARDSFIAVVDQIARQHGHRVEFWGMDQLTPLIEEHLLDEGLLLGSAKGDLRAALAGLEESETAIHRFVRFVDRCLTSPPEDAARAPATRRRDFLRRCVAATMGYGILCVWGRAEGNLKPGVVAGEYLVLRLWAAAVTAGYQDDEDFQTRFAAAMSVHMLGLQEYFEKVGHALVSPRELVRYRHNHVFYTQLLFEELGRLGTLLLSLQHVRAPTEDRDSVRQAIAAVINSNVACLRPVLDDQSIDLALVLAALLGEGDTVNARNVVLGVIVTLRRTLANPDYLPVDSDLLEDAIATQLTGGIEPRTFFKQSTLIPMLGSVAALLGDDTLLDTLREMQPQLAHVTLEQWWPSAALETFTGSGEQLYSVGVSRVLPGFRADAADQALADQTPPEGAVGPEAFSWDDAPCTVLVAISARLHRHPLPTWFLARATRGWLVPVTVAEVPGGQASEAGDSCG
jgi:hypothetical protein